MRLASNLLEKKGDFSRGQSSKLTVERPYIDCLKGYSMLRLLYPCQSDPLLKSWLSDVFRLGSFMTVLCRKKGNSEL